jgi:hypothetical protein
MQIKNYRIGQIIRPTSKKFIFPKKFCNKLSNPPLKNFFDRKIQNPQNLFVQKPQNSQNLCFLSSLKPTEAT